MSTNSTISVVCKDGIVKSVYCHYYYYMNNTGNILKQYYVTPELAEELVDKGAISYLEPTINDTYFFHSGYDKPTTIATYDSLQDYIINADRHFTIYGLVCNDCNFIFMNDHKWYLYLPVLKCYREL